MLKNINYKQIQQLSALLDYQEGQIVSKTLIKNKAVSATLFAFDEKEAISTHEANGDALVIILDGTAKLVIDDETFVLSTNESIVMPAHHPHAVYAQTPFKMLLLVFC